MKTLKRLVMLVFIMTLLLSLPSALRGSALSYEKIPSGVTGTSELSPSVTDGSIPAGSDNRGAPLLDAVVENTGVPLLDAAIEDTGVPLQGVMFDDDGLLSINH